MPDKIVSHNSSNEGYQHVTAIPELSCPAEEVLSTLCNSYMINDLYKFGQCTYLRHFFTNMGTEWPRQIWGGGGKPKITKKKK